MFFSFTPFPKTTWIFLTISNTNFRHDVLEVALSPAHHQNVASWHDICDFFVTTISAACKPTYTKMEGTLLQFGPNIPHIPSSI
jgi:hypothetical protein